LEINGGHEMQLNIFTSQQSRSASELVTVPCAEYQALRQFYESTKALQKAVTEPAASAAIAALNAAEEALYVIDQPAERLRRRVQIVDAA
jgi:hypothetical protein